MPPRWMPTRHPREMREFSCHEQSPLTVGPCIALALSQTATRNASLAAHNVCHGRDACAAEPAVAGGLGALSHGPAAQPPRISDRGCHMPSNASRYVEKKTDEETSAPAAQRSALRPRSQLRPSILAAPRSGRAPHRRKTPTRTYTDRRVFRGGRRAHQQTFVWRASHSTLAERWLSADVARHPGR